MDAKRLAKIENQIRLKIEAVFKAGSFVNDGDHLGVHDPKHAPDATSGCCIMGSVLLGEKRPSMYIHDAARVLGVEDDEACAIEHGFRGSAAHEDQDLDLWDLGRRLRLDYVGAQRDPNTEAA